MIYGGDGTDFIYGSHGHNTIYAGAGNDVISVHYGRGVVDCGPGRDIYHVARSRRKKYRFRNCEKVDYRPESVRGGPLKPLSYGARRRAVSATSRVRDGRGRQDPHRDRDHALPRRGPRARAAEAHLRASSCAAAATCRCTASSCRAHV